MNKINERLPSKRVLLVYPNNLLTHKSGINLRFREWVSYFKSRGYVVDQLGLNHFDSHWDGSELISDDYPVDNLYVVDHRKGRKLRKGNIRYLVRRFFEKFFLFRVSELPDFVFPELKTRFSQLISENNYDSVLISYVYWAELINAEGLDHVQKILELSDCMTLNISDATKGRIKFDNLMNEEFRRINLFDKVICISHSEYTLFSNACPDPEFYFVPVFMDKSPVSDGKKSFDVLFFGSSNVHNRAGMQWFSEHVMPFLKGVNILVAGTIADYLPDSEHITKIRHVENVNELYTCVKCAVAPFVGGTGMKIKVVEAMAHGVPVISTSSGLAGIPGEYKCKLLCSDSPETFASLINQLISSPEFSQNQIDVQNEVFDSLFNKEHILRPLDGIFQKDTGLRQHTNTEVEYTAPVRCYIRISALEINNIESILNRHYEKDDMFELFSNRDKRGFNEMPLTDLASVKCIKTDCYGIHSVFDRPVLYFTFLRSPIERILSFYCYVKKNPSHPLFEIIEGQSLSIKECVERKVSFEFDNLLVRSLSGWMFNQKDISGYEGLTEKAKTNLDERFCFVGFQEGYSQDVKKVCRLMGWKRLPINKTSEENRKWVDTLSDEDIDAIIKHNRWDIDFYNYARKKAGYEPDHLKKDY